MAAPQFSDDNPKSNPWTEDKLGFAPFAKRLAASIVEVEAPNGYVIGLQGAWGSGKSTALNFVQAMIKKYNEEVDLQNKPIHVIDFRPWIVSGHQDLIESFFKIISEQLADQRDAWTKRGRSSLRTLRRNVDPLVDAAASLGSILAPGIGTLGGVGIKLASEAVKKNGSSKLDEWLAEPSLQSAYDKLRNRIVESEEKFLVIIDDIDRLDKSEIKSIMQMVKTLGRLPNVIYLLSYDKNIVWGAFEEDSTKHVGKPNFMEKIIQQEINLPRPKKEQLLNMLDAEIGFLTHDTPHNDRWYNIVTSGVQRWIQQPRDVARLSNAVKFTWPAIEGEVDPQDVLAIEGVRLFHPEIFEWIRDNRHIFWGSEWDMASEEGRKKLGADFLTLTNPKNQESILRLLCTLIPAASRMFEHMRMFNLSDEPYSKVASRRGIGSEAAYDTYFSLHQSPETISKKSLNKAMSPTTGKEEQIKLIENFISIDVGSNNSIVGTYFQELRFILEDNVKIPVPMSLMEAIFDLGGAINLLNQRVGSFIASPKRNAQYLLGDICRNVDASHLASALKYIFEHRSTVGFCAEFWFRRAEESGLIKSDELSNNPVLDTNFVRELHVILIRRIEGDMQKCLAEDDPYFYYIAQAWSFNGNEDVVKKFISLNSLSSGKFLAKICRALVGYTVGSNPRIYSMHNHPDEIFYDYPSLLLATEKFLADKNLSEDERSMIKAVHKGLSLIVHKKNQHRTGEE